MTQTVSMTDETQTKSGFVNPKINIRLVLAALWASHFLIWTFGDMLALLQQLHEPLEAGSVEIFIAPTTAIAQALMIVLCLVGRPTIVRKANFIVASVFLLFNMIFMVDAAAFWEYYLGVFYILFSAAIIWFAYHWPTKE